ncbi:MAG: threonine/serine exporter family protein [Clostridia bacterium]|nr:threonine/serine exporter family protein [Clostridia bacterium]
MMDFIVTLITSFLGTLGFALLLHAPKKAWLPASIIGGISYTLYIVLLQAGWHQAAAMFAGALAGSVLAQVCARRMRMIATIFITLSIVSLVPGLGLYRCMEFLGAGKNAAGLQAGVSAMIDIMMIALGLAVGNFVFRMFCRPQAVKG